MPDPYAQITETKKPCPEFPFFGASYPDTTCIDGFLWDLDKCDCNGQLYSIGDNPPRPFCNSDEYIEYYIDEEEGITKELILKHIEKLRVKYS